MAGKELDSWIYVLIMIVISIFGAINKSRKKKELESNPPMEEEEEYDEPDVATSNDFWPEFKTEPAPFLDVELENVQPAVPVAPQQTMAPMAEITEEYASVDLDDPEEMRKAVIYSEIMKRKF